MPVDIFDTKVPCVRIPSGERIPVLHPAIGGQFVNFPPRTQRETIRILEGLLEQIRSGGSLAHLHELGLIDDDELKADKDKDVYKGNTIDACCWQLAQLLRYSIPTRISEAVPHLTYIVDHTTKNMPYNAPTDVIPLYYLGVALARNGEDQRAIETLEMALTRVETLAGATYHPANMIWARAHLAWVFRRTGRVADAEEQEDRARNWILTHPYACPPSVILDMVTDPDIEELGANIINDPMVEGLLSRTMQLAPGLMVHLG